MGQLTAGGLADAAQHGKVSYERKLWLLISLLIVCIGFLVGISRQSGLPDICEHKGYPGAHFDRG